MSARVERALLVTGILGALVLAFCAVGLLTQGGILALDAAALEATAQGPPMLVTFSKLMDFAGGTVVITTAALVAALILYVRGRPWGALRLALVVLAAQAGNLVLKTMFAAPRPESPLIEAHGYAFPSGHASAAAVLAVLAWWYSLRLRRTPLTVFALVIGSLWALGMAASRVILQVHSATDVVAGLGYGTAVASFGLLLTLWSERRWPLPAQPREPT